MTVEQLVLHGRFAYLGYPRVYTKKDKDIAAGAMERMGIARLAQKNLCELSGGMRQNAYIAMALAQCSDYILLDEPTTYLDISNRLQLTHNMRTLARDGKGVIAVLHDLTLAMEFADEIAVIKDGALIIKADPEEIFSQDIIRKVFGVGLKRSFENGSFSYYYDNANFAQYENI